MLSKIAKSIDSKFSNPWMNDKFLDKQHRINQIFKVVDINFLLKSFSQFTLKSIEKEKKCEKEAKDILESANYLYLSEDTIIKAIKKLNKVYFCLFLSLN